MYIGDYMYYAVSYQYHTKNETFNVNSIVWGADNLGKVIDEVDRYLSKLMEDNHWSDYAITAIVLIPELH